MTENIAIGKVTRHQAMNAQIWEVWATREVPWLVQENDLYPEPSDFRPQDIFGPDHLLTSFLRLHCDAAGSEAAAHSLQGIAPMVRDGVPCGIWVLYDDEDLSERDLKIVKLATDKAFAAWKAHEGQPPSKPGDIVSGYPDGPELEEARARAESEALASPVGQSPPRPEPPSPPEPQASGGQ